MRLLYVCNAMRRRIPRSAYVSGVSVKRSGWWNDGTTLIREEMAQMYHFVNAVKELSAVLEVNEHLKNGWRIIAIYSSDNKVIYVVGSLNLPNT